MSLTPSTRDLTSLKAGISTLYDNTEAPEMPTTDDCTGSRPDRRICHVCNQRNGTNLWLTHCRYYSKSSAQLTGLIESSVDGPAFMRINSVDPLPYNLRTGAGNGAGRPSVRIASQKSWTHGLFIGDFARAPVGVCGAWPACKQREP